MKKNNPETSNEAFRSLTPDMITKHHNKIIIALRKLGEATYEEIARAVKMERHQVGRRLSELEREQIVYKPGNKKSTKSGRHAFVYRLYEVKSTDQELQQFMDDWQGGKLEPKEIVQAKLFLE